MKIDPDPPPPLAWRFYMHISLTDGGGISVYQHPEQQRLYLYRQTKIRKRRETFAYGETREVAEVWYEVGDQVFAHYHRALRYARSDAAD